MLSNFIVVDMVNNNRGEMAFAARGHAPLSDVVLSLSMSTTIVHFLRLQLVSWNLHYSDGANVYENACVIAP